MKKSLSLLLTLAFVLVLLPAVVFAAATKPTSGDLQTPPVISNLDIASVKGDEKEEGKYRLTVKLTTPANVLNAVEYFENHEKGFNQAGYISNVEMQYSVNNGEWIDAGLNYSASYGQTDADNGKSHWNGVFETVPLTDIKTSDYIKARARYAGADAEGNAVVSDWSNIVAMNIEKADKVAPATTEKAQAAPVAAPAATPVSNQDNAAVYSDWAKAELAEAKEIGIVPDALKGKDLTKPVTRAEFAAVMVKCYEYMGDRKVEKPESNPFTDTKDSDVLKANALGIVTGTSANTFSPDEFLNREQAAVMLTRLYKTSKFGGWTLENDAEYATVFAESYKMPGLYADDMDISPWAKESVYFLRATGVMGGVGDNLFAPKPKNVEGTAAHYGGISREQALITAKRMSKVEN